MAVSQARSVVARIVGQVFVCAHSPEAPRDDEWDRMLAHYRNAPNYSALRILVHTDGGNPNPAQRSRLIAAFLGRSVPVAVVTLSETARSASVAVRWFQPLLRLFEPTDFEGALTYLEIEGNERLEVRRALVELRAELRGSAAPS